MNTDAAPKETTLDRTISTPFERICFPITTASSRRAMMASTFTGLVSEAGFTGQARILRRAWNLFLVCLKAALQAGAAR